MHLHLHVKLHENPPFYNLYVLCIVSIAIEKVYLHVKLYENTI